MNNFTEHSFTSFFYNHKEGVGGDQFILPMWRQIFWSMLYGGLVIVATGGNLIVIWIIFSQKWMLTVTDYFLLNLSVADTILSTLNFMATVALCASVLSLMCISFDRYMVIITPLKKRISRGLTVLLAMTTWFLGIIMGSPFLMFFNTYKVHNKEGEETVICYSIWPDGKTNDSIIEHLYNVGFFFLAYVVPVGSMTYTYGKIGIKLWGSQTIGECTERQMQIIRSKKQAVKMMMVIVIVFAVCWLPYHLYFIVTAYFPQITNFAYIRETYLIIYWLAMSNSMFNPMIYCWMYTRFRRGFKQFFSSLRIRVSRSAKYRHTMRRRSSV
ncbi:Tachykinin-like peptides receptor 99D [Tribolium castaneum]|uniref:Tachykinin-like peptides receptor 99D n=1 Tax=Tribolium castaneum TaxID=7070 RepID=A0A139WB32_TRICA|nr:Tachykinin-like peptides receptor 99D [Tribolium castaneum]